MSKAVLKEVMAEILEEKGCNATQHKLDALWEKYEQKQKWEPNESGTDYMMVTGTTYVDVQKYVTHSKDVEEVFGKAK